MLFSFRICTHAALLVLGIAAALPLMPVLRSDRSGAASQERPPEPWAAAQVLHAADLVSQLGNSNSSSAPTIVYVGFRTLFEGGHVPEASFHGTASTEKGLAELKKWLAALPRSTDIVVYCGCCPFDHCPNIRPAYKALHELGFPHVRVLVLPTSFAVDWVEKGYPIEKGL